MKDAIRAAWDVFEKNRGGGGQSALVARLLRIHAEHLGEVDRWREAVAARLVRVADAPTRARIARSLGDELRDTGRYDEAVHWTRLALEAGRDDPDAGFRCLLLASHGDTLRHLGPDHAAEARDHFRLALALADAGSDTDLRCKIHYYAGVQLTSTGQTREGFALLARAVELADGLFHADRRCEAFYAYGKALFDDGEFEQAGPLLRRAAREAESSSSAMTRESAFRFYADLLARDLKLKTAASYLKKAFRAAVRADPRVRPGLMNQLGEVHRVRGDVYRAEQCYLETIRMVDDLRANGLATPADLWTAWEAECGRATIRFEQGQLTEAEVLFRAAARHARSLPDCPPYCTVSARLAFTLIHLGRLPEADDILLRLGEPPADYPRDFRVAYLEVVATLRRKQERFDEAEELARRVVAESRGLNRLAVFHAHLNLADLLLDRGRPDAAAPHLEAARSHLRYIEHPLPRASLAGAEGMLAYQRGDWAGAATTLWRGTQLILDTVSRNRRTEGFGRLLKQFLRYLRHGVRACARQFARDRSEEHLWMGLAFTDAVSCVVIREGLRRVSGGRAGRHKAAAWEPGPVDLDRLFTPAGGLVGARGRAAVRGASSAAPHEQPLFFELPEDDQEAKRELCRPIGREELRQVLDDGAVLVRFFSDDDDLLVIPVRQCGGAARVMADGTDFFRIPGVLSRLDALAGDVRAAVCPPGGVDDLGDLPDLDPYCRELHRLLNLDALLTFFEPDPGRWSGLHLVVIPDAGLFKLPLHAARGADGAYLYERVASLRYALSLGTLLHQRQLAADEPLDGRVGLEGVAFVSPGGRLDRWLEHASDEARALADAAPGRWRFFGENADLADGTYYASRANFARWHRSGNVLWTIGHGEEAEDVVVRHGNDGRSPVAGVGPGPGARRSGFRTPGAGGEGEEILGRWPALQLEDGPVSTARLVAERYDFRPVWLWHLSCCVLGDLKDAQADKQVEGFVAALVLLGCRRISSAMWYLDDDAAAAFARHWAAALRRHVFDAPARGPHAYAVAFRDALTALRQEPGYDHPFYWAPYTLYGIG